MKKLVRWRIEGEALVDTDDDNRACDHVVEVLQADETGMFSRANCGVPSSFTMEFPEILGCTTVDRGNK